MRTLPFLFLLVSPATAFQTFHPPPSALARPGLHHANIEGRFVDATGEPVADVIVQLAAGKSHALPVAAVHTDSDGRFVFREVDSRHWPELHWFPPKQWRKGQAALTGESATTIDTRTITLNAAVALDIGVEIEAQGRVLAPDHTPITGALVSVSSPRFTPFAIHQTTTDANGRFALRYRAAACREPAVTLGGRTHWDAAMAVKETCEQRWTKPQDIVMRKATQLSLVTPGFDETKVKAFWWHESLGWQAFPSLRSWISLNGQGSSDLTLKVESPGHLPLTKTIHLPWVDDKQKELPTIPPVEFKFTPSVPRELIVFAAGRPLSGVTVDVELVTDLARKEHQMLASYRTPSSGKLNLASTEEALVEVFVYAAGFAPARAIWNPGRTLIIDLVPLNSTLVIPASQAKRTARLQHISSSQAVRFRNLEANQPTAIPVPPGIFDITFYDARGKATSYQRKSVSSGETAVVDLQLDQRPRLTLRVPDPAWHPQVTAATPPGFADNPTSEIVSTAEENVFLLSRAGRMRVEVKLDREGRSLWRDIDIRPGESITLTLERPTGTILGTTRSYDGGIGSAHHGWAGPRLQLINDDPSQWSVTDYLPRRHDAHFVLHGIPTGTYHLHHHLIGEKNKFPGGPQALNDYTFPIDAWGGIPVKVGDDPVRLKDLIDYARQPLAVTVRDSKGQPVQNATIRIRDRMSEVWHRWEENSRLDNFANDQIPYPAAARLAYGTATLPSVRTGRLELLVELDSGGTYSFIAHVGADHTVALTLP